MRIATIALAAAVLPVWAQEFRLPESLDKLAEKAEESVTVTLDKSMLQLASRFLDRNSGNVDMQKLVAGLDSIYVRSYEFARDGKYSPADVEAVRSQLQPPAWSRIAGVRCRRSGEDVDVYFKNAGHGQLGGIVIVAAEARELTIVKITGTIDLERLVDLGGEFGIPRLEAAGRGRDIE